MFCATHWIEIYPANSVIHLLTNQDLLHNYLLKMIALHSQHLPILTLYLSQTYPIVPQSEQCKFLHPVWGLLSLKKKKKFLASWVTNNKITFFSGKNKVYLHFEWSKTPTWCSCAWSLFWIQGINIITYMNWTIATNETATKITKLLLFQSLSFQEQLTSILTSQ